MTLTTCSILELGLDPSAATLNRSFGDYRVPIQFTAASLTQAARIDGVDLAESRILLDDKDPRGEEPMGAALIARRGWRSRLAAMAIAPEARGQGVGHWFMTMLIEEAKARDDRQMVLEVITDNTAAVKLYQRMGFQNIRRLVSLRMEGNHSPEQSCDQALQEVDVNEVAAIVAAHGLPDLPWQLAGETIAQFGPPYRAYRLADAYVVLSDPARESIGIRSCIVKRESRGMGQAKALLQAVRDAYPNKTLQIPAICPAELSGVFIRTGFLEDTLAQLQMQLRLS